MVPVKRPTGTDPYTPDCEEFGEFGTMSFMGNCASIHRKQDKERNKTVTVFELALMTNIFYFNLFSYKCLIILNISTQHYQTQDKSSNTNMKSVWILFQNDSIH